MTQPVASLRDHFGEIFERSDRDPILHLVVLTYEFDDQQVLNLSALQPLGKAFEPRMSHLARIAEIVPVMIYDARKTSAGQRLPHFMELLPARVPAYTCHHPKAYLVVTASCVHLVTGSMNLTRSGLFANREVFDSFRWTDRDTDDRGVLAEFARILRAGYGQFESAPLEAAFKEIESRLARWEGLPDAGHSTLIHQGYDSRSGLSALTSLWASTYGNDSPPKRAIVVSPFFDKTAETRVLADDLFAAFPKLTQLDVITDEAVSAHLSQKHFRGPPSTQLFLIPKEIGAAERTRIEQANQPIDTTDLAIERKLHAKLLILARGEEALVYLGSGNFTRKAWLGDNREMGVARPASTSADALLRSLLKSLCASATDRFQELPLDEPSVLAPDDEDDYSPQPDYPEFVQSIELQADGDPGCMAFVVRAREDDTGPLADYRVTWDAIELHFTGGRSQPLSHDLLARCLLGRRNLCFALRANPANPYYLPFRHSAELFAQRERYVYPSSEDWMLYQLFPDMPLDRDTDEYVPGDTPLDEEDAAAIVTGSRDKNPIIRMQGYLNLFSRVEKEFCKRAQACADSPAAGLTDRWNREIAAPLLTFAEVISQESKADPTSSEAVFKLGELGLLATKLAAIHPAGAPLVKRLRGSLPSHHTIGAVGDYLRFCHSQLQS